MLSIQNTNQPGMSSEDSVIEEVVRYFSKPRFHRYSVQKEGQIQFGSRIGFADVVLLDGKKKRIAIVECKGIGYVDNGIEQLKSYLSATATSFGVFANSTNPDDWQFYENLGENQFSAITRSQFESAILKTGLIGRFNRCLRRLFARKESNDAASPDPISRASQSSHYKPYSTFIGGTQTVQNRHDLNPGPSPNNSPYYTEENGFRWATNHNGSPEALPPHIKRIVNDEVERQSNPEWYEESIRTLREEKSKLEDSISNCESEIVRRTEELAMKEEDLAKSDAQLTALREEESNLMDLLHPGKNHLLGKQQRSWGHLITGIVATVLLVGLASYLFVFYASAVDKAFFLKDASIAGLNDIVNPDAIFEALEGRWNLFVIFFPFIFLVFAIALDHFWESSEQWWQKWPAVGLLIATFLFDGILAIQISQKLHDTRVLIGLTEGEWEFRWNDLNIWTVLFCGFMVSLLVSILYHVTRERWKGVKPDHIDKEKEERTRLGIQKRIDEIKTEKVQKETQRAATTTAMQNARNVIDGFKNDKIPELRRRIEEIDTEIHNLSTQRVIDRGRIESQISQFLNGWIQYVVNRYSGDDEKVLHIRQIAATTLEGCFREDSRLSEQT